MQMKIIPRLFRNSLLITTVLCLWMIQQIKAQGRSIDQIQFSKDSSTIIGFSINDKTFNLVHSIPLLQWPASLNQQARIQYKIIQTAKIGWTKFTDDVILSLSSQKNSLVFILWGNFAQEKIKLIDSSKHKILKAAHPSPFSAYNGFFGCKHFSATNEYLVKNNIDPIDWAI